MIYMHSTVKKYIVLSFVKWPQRNDAVNIASASGTEDLGSNLAKL
jgi:hypothetical protein